MSKKYMLDAENLCAFNTNVKAILNLKSVYFSIFICVLALAIIFLSSYVEDKSSATYMGGITLAVVLMAIGFHRLITRRLQIIYIPTKSTMRKGSFYSDSKQLPNLKAAISNKEQSNISYTNLDILKSGNVRLDYVVSNDGKFAAVQLYEYVPYNFEAVTDVICYENEQAHNLGLFLLKNHGKY